MTSNCVLFILTQGRYLKFYFTEPNAFYQFTKYTRNRAEIHRFRPAAKVRVRYQVTAFKGKQRFLDVGCQTKAATKVASILFRRNPDVSRVKITKQGKTVGK